VLSVPGFGGGLYPQVELREMSGESNLPPTLRPENDIILLVGCDTHESGMSLFLDDGL
jgi:hypothetical protein